MKSLLLITFSIITLLFAQADPQYVEIKTLDGNTFVGTVIHEDENVVILKSVSGNEYTIPVEQIKSREIAVGLEIEEQEVTREDPNYSAYFLTSNAFSIQKKSQYCTDRCVIFPSMTYAFTNSFSGHAGTMIFPGMTALPFYLYLKWTLHENDRSAAAVGFEDFSILGQHGTVGVGAMFGSFTLGNHKTNATLSVLYGYSRLNSDWERTRTPIFVLGGAVHITEHLAWVTENYRFDHETTLLSFGPRIISEFISVDFALVTTVDVLRNSEGFPFFPFVGFTYRMKNH